MKKIIFQCALLSGGLSFVFFVSCVPYAFASVHCCIVVTCWERTDLLSLACDVYCSCLTFPCGILSWVWYLILSFPDLFRLSNFNALKRVLGSKGVEVLLKPEVRVQVYINALVKHCLIANNVCFINLKKNGALYCIKT